MQWASPSTFSPDSLDVFPGRSTCGEAGGRLHRSAIMKTIYTHTISGWHLSLLVSIVTSAFSNQAFSEEDKPSLPPVVVTANRFEDRLTAMSASITIITAEQIRSSGASDVNEAIRKIAGVLGRQNLTGSSDSALDLRGFGTTSEQNLVVMVDGIRLSEIDLSNALMSSIPVDSVERIELTRGGSSVLYGNGATGGTIHIITKKGDVGSQTGSVAAIVGNYGHREARANLSTGVEALVVDINASTRHSDGFRANGYSEQTNLGLGLHTAIEGGRIGLRTNFSNQESGLPGSLNLSQFTTDMRQTLKPNDYGTTDASRYVFFMERKLGDWDYAADLSYRTQRAVGNYPSMPYTSVTNSDMYQFSPRIKHITQANDIRHETVAGVDLIRSSARGYSEAAQDSEAFYLRHEMRVSQTSVALGARREIFNSSSSGMKQDLNLNAWEVMAAHDLNANLGLYGKTGRSYRVANVNEITGAVGVLLPQTSNDFEVGTQIKNNNGHLKLNWFRHDLRNEIIYNPIAPSADPLFPGANVNLDPTRREGVEVRITQSLSSDWSMQATAQHVSPTFRDGPNVGKEIPLVAKNTLSARLTWLPVDGRRADVGWQAVDSQRYGNDFANTCSTRIPRFDTLDARYAWRSQLWEFAIAGSNLTDKNYFSTAYGECRNGIYPDAGRLVQLTARRAF